MKTATIDQRRLAARINLVDEHMRAENEHDVDRTMATLTESPDYKFNDEEFGGHESVREFYSDVFQCFPDMHRSCSRLEGWSPCNSVHNVRTNFSDLIPFYSFECRHPHSLTMERRQSVHG